jgi:hypothetical protein
VIPGSVGGAAAREINKIPVGIPVSPGSNFMPAGMTRCTGVTPKMVNKP